MYWAELLETPGVVVMVPNIIPDWIQALSDLRPLALLTSSEQTLEKARSLRNISAGLLKGFSDICEFYRVIGELIEQLRPVPRLFDQIPNELRTINTSTLLEGRPKLDFIDYLPSPQPWAGRSACVLLNRLSNAAEELFLLDPEHAFDPMVPPAMLNWASAACGVLAARENGVELSLKTVIEPGRIEQLEAFLRSPAKPNRKFEMFMSVGRMILGEGTIRRPFVTIPVPRKDLLRNPPKEMSLDLREPFERRIAIKAMKEFVSGEKQSTFESADAKDVYETSRYTILQEQRLLACEAVWLSSIGQQIPIQLMPRSGDVPAAHKDFMNALAHNSGKSSELFRLLELELAGSLPEGMVGSLLNSASSVTLFSDYPYEWTLIDDRPLCLHRPTTRIPLSMSSWYNISAALQQPYQLSTARLKMSSSLILSKWETGSGLLQTHSSDPPLVSATNSQLPLQRIHGKRDC